MVAPLPFPTPFFLPFPLPSFFACPFPLSIYLFIFFPFLFIPYLSTLNIAWLLHFPFPFPFTLQKILTSQPYLLEPFPSKIHIHPQIFLLHNSMKSHKKLYIEIHITKVRTNLVSNVSSSQNFLIFQFYDNDFGLLKLGLESFIYIIYVVLCYIFNI